MTAGDRDALVEVLGLHQTFYLATAAGDEPWINGAFYGYDLDAGFTVYCAARDPSKKLDNLRRNPRVAFLVAGARPDLWLQGTGTAEVLEDPGASKRAFERVAAHAPDVVPFLSSRPHAMVRVAVRAFKITDLRDGRKITFVEAP